MTGSTNGYALNNPGNLRYIATKPRQWKGQIGEHNGFGMYASRELGTRALGQQLLSYARRGIVTIHGIITTWAPPGENDTAAYITALVNELGSPPDEPLEVFMELALLARGIARHENGYLDTAYDWEWVYLP